MRSTPVVANIGAYGRVIHEKYRIRQLILACQRVSAQGYGDYGEPQAFIDNAEQAIYNIARTSSKQSVEKLIEVMKKAFAKLNDELRAEIEGAGGDAHVIELDVTDNDVLCVVQRTPSSWPAMASSKAPEQMLASRVLGCMAVCSQCTTCCAAGVA